MNNTLEAVNQVIRTRRSIFPPEYIKEEIPRHVIEAILENANYAPTHRLTQPWRFVIFRGEGLVKLADFLADIYRSQTPAEAFSQTKYEGTRQKILAASCVAAIVMEVHPEKVPEWEELASVACAVQNMWLTATALNVGGYWSTPGNLHLLSAFLELKDNQKCVGFFYMGYHQAKQKPAVRTPMDEKVRWVEE